MIDEDPPKRTHEETLELFRWAADNAEAIEEAYIQQGWLLPGSEAHIRAMIERVEP